MEGWKRGKRGTGKNKKSNRKGKKRKICEKMTDLHKKRGVQINVICYDIRQSSTKLLLIWGRDE